MTVDSQTNKISYVPDGVEDTFAFDFRVDEADDMVVYADNVVYTEGRTVTDLTNPDGGNVIFDVAPLATISDLTLVREVPLTQATKYPALGPFPASSHEAALDKLTFAAQQQAEVLSRAGIAPIDADPATDFTLPKYAAGEVWLWDLTSQRVITDSLEVTVDTAGVLTASTMAALRMLTPSAENDQAKLLGYVTKGDGAGGPDRYGMYGQAPGTYVDNGGSVTVPNGGDGSAAWLIRTSGFLDALWFGLDRTGVGLGTVKMQAAWDASVAGGLECVISSGTYTVANLDWPTGLHFRGRGKVLIKCDASQSGVEWISGADQSGGGSKNVCKNVEFDFQSNVSGANMLVMGDNPRNWLVKKCVFRNMKERPAIRANYISANAGNGNLRVVDCKFYDGDSAGGINFRSEVAGIGIENLTVRDCDIMDCGSNMLFIATGDGSKRDTFKNTIVKNVRFRGNGTGANGAIPTELWGHNSLVISGCEVENGTRGLGFAWSDNVTCSGNVIKDQSIYAHEVQDVANVTITGETAVNCARFLQNSSLVGERFKNITVTGNTIVGTGLSAYTSNSWMIRGGLNAGDKSNINISDNTFRDIEYVDGAIRSDETKDVTIHNNKLHASTEVSALALCSTSQMHDVVISNNTINMSVDYTANHQNYDNSPPMIGIPPDGSNIDVINNKLIMSGLNAGGGIIGIGSFSGSADYDNVFVKGNRLIGTFDKAGIYINDTSGTLIVEKNDMRLFVSATPYTINAATVLKNLINEYSGTSIPLTGTFKDGDTVKDESATAGSFVGWSCTSTGTMGTLVGITGGITVSTDQLTVNNASGLKINQFITIAGVSGTKRIRAIDGLVVTINSNADATVAGAAIAFDPAVFKTYGAIAA